MSMQDYELEVHLSDLRHAADYIHNENLVRSAMAVRQHESQSSELATAQDAAADVTPPTVHRRWWRAPLAWRRATGGR